MAVGYAFVFGGRVLLISGWMRIYYVRDRLVTDGVYGVVRHPQYLAIFIAIFGQLVHCPTIPTLVFAPVIIFPYVRLPRPEAPPPLHPVPPAFFAYPYPNPHS